MNFNDDQNNTAKGGCHPFDRQSVDTTLNISDVREILSYYSSQPYLSHRRILAGTRSSNYCIISEDQSYYLCKIYKEKTKDNVWLQLKALIALQSYGLPLAYPLKRQQNSNKRANNSKVIERTANNDESLIADYIVDINSIGLPIVMYEWKHSRTGNFLSVSSISYASLGTALARIHSVDYRAFLYLPSFPFGMASMLPIYYEQLPKLSESLQQHPFVSVLNRELQHICQSLYGKTSYEVYKDRDYIAKENSKNSENPLPLGILHGDLFLDNSLFHPNNELEAIVDWEDISVGERLIDVTMAIVGCCFDDTDSLSIPRATAFLAAYQNILSLTAGERQYFETFLRYSFLSIACFRWYRFNVLSTSSDNCNSYLPMLKRMDAINTVVVEQLLSA